LPLDDPEKEPLFQQFQQLKKRNKLLKGQQHPAVRQFFNAGRTAMEILNQSSVPPTCLPQCFNRRFIPNRAQLFKPLAERAHVGRASPSQPAQSVPQAQPLTEAPVTSPTRAAVLLKHTPSLESHSRATEQSPPLLEEGEQPPPFVRPSVPVSSVGVGGPASAPHISQPQSAPTTSQQSTGEAAKIGRASCRERVLR
jgi:hypothetical protein